MDQQPEYDQQQQLEQYQPPQLTLPHVDLDSDTNKQLVVIGGGISGISTAYYLQRMGKDVLLIESLDDVGQGATKVSVPLLQRYQAPIVSYDLLEKRKSQYCPVRMWYRAQQFADTFTNKAFYRAYGFEGFKNMLDNKLQTTNLEKLTYLTQSNYNEALNIIKEEEFPMVLSNGHLFVGDDKTGMKSHTADFRRFRILYKDYDTFELKHDDPTMLFPSLQQDGMELYGGLYTPSSLVFHPTVFSKFLQQKIVQNNQNNRQNGNNIDPRTGKVIGNVNFMFNTKAVGFTLTPQNNIKSVLLEHREEIPESAEEIESRRREQEEKLAALRKFEEEHAEEFKGQSLPGPNAGELKERPKQYRPISTSEVGIDKVVLCNGYQAFQITEKLHENGPLLHVIPVRSLAFDIYDKTRARFDKSVPSLFQTYPATFFPEDPEFTRVQMEWEKRRKELGIEDEGLLSGRGRLRPSHPLLAPPKVEPLTTEEIEQNWVQDKPMNLHGVSSVEFSRNGLTLVQNLHNPRHFYGYMGKDMAQIGPDITDRHLQSIMSVLENIRKIPEGSLIEPDYEKEIQSRREQGRKPRGGRYLSMQPNSMALHTVGRDGLPVIGPTAHIPNLYFNTGHGTSPQNTAIIGAKFVANIIADETASNYSNQFTKKLLLDRGEKLPNFSQFPASASATTTTTTTDQIIENPQIVFEKKPTKFYLDHLFNIHTTLRSKLDKIPIPGSPADIAYKKALEEEQIGNAVVNDPNSAVLSTRIDPALLPSFNDFSPSRWPLHHFTPYWFDDVETASGNDELQKREAIEKREAKRQQIAERIAARKATTEQQVNQ
jgi:glycine/D-amino acid oxidase-like deaminating enzyme